MDEAEVLRASSLRRRCRDATAVSSLALCCSRAEEAEGVFVQVRRVCALWLVWLGPFARRRPPSPAPLPRPSAGR